jgi:hypothetical protein
MPQNAGALAISHFRIAAIWAALVFAGSARGDAAESQGQMMVSAVVFVSTTISATATTTASGIPTGGPTRGPTPTPAIAGQTSASAASTAASVSSPASAQPVLALAGDDAATNADAGGSSSDTPAPSATDTSKADGTPAADLGLKACATVAVSCSGRAALRVSLADGAESAPNQCGVALDSPPAPISLCGNASAGSNVIGLVVEY